MLRWKVWYSLWKGHLQFKRVNMESTQVSSSLCSLFSLLEYNDDTAEPLMPWHFWHSWWNSNTLLFSSLLSKTMINRKTARPMFTQNSLRDMLPVFINKATLVRDHMLNPYVNKVLSTVQHKDPLCNKLTIIGQTIRRTKWICRTFFFASL